MTDDSASPDPDRGSGPRCPTCDSPSPNRHPAIQHESEVQICRDDFHTPVADGLWRSPDLEDLSNSAPSTHDESPIVDLGAWRRRNLPVSTQWLPACIIDLIHRSTTDERTELLSGFQFLDRLSDDEILDVTESELRAYGAGSTDPEVDLCYFLLPEVCERICPGARSRMTTAVDYIDALGAAVRRMSIHWQSAQKQNPPGTAARTKAEAIEESIRRHDAMSKARCVFLSQLDAIEVAHRVAEGIERFDIDLLDLWDRRGKVRSEFILVYMLSPMLVERMMRIAATTTPTTTTTIEGEA